MNTDERRKEFLKTAPFSSFSRADINFLKKIWVINGIGAQYMPQWMRNLMTWLFWDTLSFHIHDVNFWQQVWFHKANYWLLKYSFISIANNYRNIHKDKWYRKLYRVPVYYLTLPFKAIIISLAYSLVESPVWKKAYQNAWKIK